jgi:ABC-2 type transport system ATP-binding protein
MLAPTEGSVAVLGRDPRGEPAALADVGYVSQGAPLYRTFSVAETLAFAAATNPRWDDGLARELLASMDSSARVARLSAGDRARLALALALGKRPALLLVDDPLARLDPLAGRALLRLLMDGVSETGSTVVIASHVVADLERVCDRIVLLSEGRVRLEGDVDELLGSHVLLTGARRPLGTIRGVDEIVRERHSGRQSTLLVRTSGSVVDPSWSVDGIGLEELLLAYMAPGRLPTAPVRPPEPGRLRWHG